MARPLGDKMVNEVSKYHNHNRQELRIGLEKLA